LTKYIKLKKNTDFDADLSDEILENLKECNFIYPNLNSFKLLREKEDH
jgi:hypothetical protein